MTESIITFDFAVLDYIAENLRCGFLDTVVPIVTQLGSATVQILFALILILIPKTRKLGVSLGAALAVSVIFNNLLIKNIVARPRPYEIREGIELLIRRLNDGSFPSGHTSACFLTATVITLRKKYIAGIFAYAVAVTVAFTRLYLYVHFPTDVLGGALLGVIWAVIGCVIADMIYKKFSPSKLLPDN